MNLLRSSNPFVICGGQLKQRCGTVCDYTNSSICDIDTLDLSEEVSFYIKEDNGIVFCNPLFLDHVNKEIDLTNKTLITHNTDSSLISYNNYTATFSYLSGQVWSVNNLKPMKWLAQNSLVSNVLPIPLGVTNNDIMDFNFYDIKKSILIYKNFGIDSNPPQRQACEFNVKIPNQYVKGSSRQAYYKSLAESYFTVSPDGFGVDCHRHWEALYFNCIPIVTKNSLNDFYSKLFPIVVINDWSEFDHSLFTIDFYQSLIKKFDRSMLDIDYYINYILS